MSTRTFRYEEVNIEQITATDLCEEFLSAKNAQTFRVTIFPHEIDEPAEVVEADALYLPSEGRLGIAWGADATWADVDDVESDIEMWLNGGETWDQRN